MRTQRKTNIWRDDATGTLAKKMGALLLLSSLTACGGGSDTTGASNSVPIASTASANTIQDTNTAITLLATDSDGDSLTYTVTTQPQNGAISLTGNSVTYTPNSGFSGTDLFAFVANDSLEDSNIATVDITVFPSSSITGVITNTDGSFVDGVVIKVLDSAGMLVTTQNSSTSGEFEVKTKTDSKLILSLKKAGFATQIKTIKTPSVKNLSAPTSITMLELGSTQTIDSLIATAVNGSNGATVTLPANGFVDASGNIVTGNIDVNITPVDVSDSNILSAFPGEFTGTLTSGSQSSIVSAGTTYFDFSQNGEPLQLADGMTAEILLPIFLTTNPITGNPIELGDVIELWYLNEITGIWIQDGTGTVVSHTSSPTGYALKANVTHFTPWNVDYPMPFADLGITINGTVNGGVAIVKTRTTGANWGWSVDSSPMIVGTTQGYTIMPWSGETCVWLEYVNNTGASATSPEQCLTNVMPSSSYAMTFNVATTGSLVLYDSFVRSTYRINQNPNIAFRPQSLETTVTYAITSGTLPTGMNLTTYNGTQARITGSSIVLGSYSVTVDGTDSDGFTDSKTVSFDIVNPPPPSLYSTTYIHAAAGDQIIQDLTPRINNSTTAPISWIITKDDGSAVPAGVTISSAGILDIASFSGTDVSYKVTTFNIYGGSNTMDVNLKGPSAPILPSSGHQVYYIMGDPQITGQIYVTSISAPATSWMITNNDGTPVPSTVTISNTGLMSFDNSNGNGYSGSTYKVTATNTTGSSNELTITFMEDMPMDPCAGIPNCN